MDHDGSRQSSSQCSSLDDRSTPPEPDEASSLGNEGVHTALAADAEDSVTIALVGLLASLALLLAQAQRRVDFQPQLGGSCWCALAVTVFFMCMFLKWFIQQIRRQFEKFAFEEGNQRVSVSVFPFLIMVAFDSLNILAFCGLFGHRTIALFLVVIHGSIYSQQDNTPKNRQNPPRFKPGEKLCAVLFSWWLSVGICYTFPPGSIGLVQHFLALPLCSSTPCDLFVRKGCFASISWSAPFRMNLFEIVQIVFSVFLFNFMKAQCCYVGIWNISEVLQTPGSAPRLVNGIAIPLTRLQRVAAMVVNHIPTGSSPHPRMNWMFRQGLHFIIQLTMFSRVLPWFPVVFPLCFNRKAEVGTGDSFQQVVLRRPWSCSGRLINTYNKLQLVWSTISLELQVVGSPILETWGWAKRPKAPTIPSSFPGLVVPAPRRWARPGMRGTVEIGPYLGSRNQGGHGAVRLISTADGNGKSRSW